MHDPRQGPRGSERRFEAIVGALSDAITIRDRDERFLYANHAALVHLGFDSWEALRDTPPEAIMGDYIVCAEDGREIAMHDIPSVRILHGEADPPPLLIRTVHRATGRLRWNLLKAAPLLAENGEVEATIMITEDVTEQKRSEQRSAFLAQASAVLASSLDYEQTLRNVAQLAVPGIADWCAVDLADGEGGRKTVAVAHVDPERVSLAEELRGYVPDRLDPKRGLGLVLHSGEPLLFPEISDEMLEQAAVDERHLQVLRTLGFRSVVIVPMRLGERTVGALTLVSSESGRVLDEFDVSFAEEIAARATVATENSRLYSERSAIARTLQQNLLPERLPQIPGHDLASIYLPAFETSLVGGDFYDVWPIGEDWMIVIGDVTGKGIDAAALTALVRHTMRTASEFLSSPAELLAFIDSTLKKRPALLVCTALCLRLHGDTLTLAAGGHPLPLHITSREVKEVGEHGPLLGALPNVHWQDHTLRLQDGATLVAYTDGITDALGEDGERFGLGRLCDTLRSLGGSPAGEVIQGMTRALDEFQSGSHADDTAAIALHRLDTEGGTEEEGEAEEGEAEASALRQ